jgi:hypothetical protein
LPDKIEPELKESISQAEVDERIAVLKRFRLLLVKQRDRFRTYIDSLEVQKDLIEQGNTEDLTEHIDLEEKIVGDIMAIQKVIDPLQTMYRSAWETGEPPEVPEIQSTLKKLRVEAKKRCDRNKNLLQERMTGIRTEIKELRSNPFKRRSPYASGAAPSIIDIKG